VLIFVWLLARAFATLILAIIDDLLVIARLKWRPPMGRARWRWDTARRCIECDAPLVTCDCRPGCIGGMCPACDASNR